MKMLIGAFALVIAAPAVAQPAPAADPHAGHAQHQQQDHKGHEQQKQSGDAEHKMGCCKDGKHGACCDKAKQQGKMAECCAGHGEHKAASEKGGHAH